MKKVFALVLAAMMVVTMFAGCGGSSAPAADTNTVKIGLTGPLTGPAHFSSRRSPPPRVTQAHSGAKPSTWSFSFCSRDSGISRGM